MSRIRWQPSDEFLRLQREDRQYQEAQRAKDRRHLVLAIAWITTLTWAWWQILEITHG